MSKKKKNNRRKNNKKDTRIALTLPTLNWEDIPTPDRLCVSTPKFFIPTGTLISEGLIFEFEFSAFEDSTRYCFVFLSSERNGCYHTAGRVSFFQLPPEDCNPASFLLNYEKTVLCAVVRFSNSNNIAIQPNYSVPLPCGMSLGNLSAEIYKAVCDVVTYPEALWS